MKNSTCEDFASSSSPFLSGNGNYIGSDVETKMEETLHLHWPSPEHEQKIVPEKRSSWGRTLYSGLPATTPSCSDDSDQCCAFRDLEKAFGKSEDKNGNGCHSPIYRLVEWTLSCRDKHPDLGDHIKRSCPLADCPFSCDPEDAALAAHISSCPYSQSGKYKCPYHNKLERFMAPVQRHRRLNRTQSVREAVLKFYKLNSEKIYRALSHSPKRRRSDNQDDSPMDSSADTFASTAMGGNNIPQNTHELATNDHFNRLGNGNESSIRGFKAQRPPSQRQIRRNTSLNTPIELSSGQYYQMLMQGPCSELPVDRFSTYLPMNLQDNQMEVGISDTNDRYLSSTGARNYISPVLFSTPLMYVWVQDLPWPLHQEQTLRLCPPFSEPRYSGEELRSRNLHNLTINTSIASMPIIQTSMSDSSTSLSDQFLSSPSNPEVLSYEPEEFLQQLRSVFWNTCVTKYSQSSNSPKIWIVKDINNRQASASTIFDSGWDAVEMVLNGKVPNTLWLLICLAELAFACGQVVWENEIIDQRDELIENLNDWSSALPNTQERLSYQEFIETTFAGGDHNSKKAPRSNWSSPILYGSDPVYKYQDPLSPNSKHFCEKLQGGVVVRLCLQLLSTFEFLQTKIEHNRNASTQILPHAPYTVGLHNQDNGALVGAVIQSLRATNEFEIFGSVLEKAVSRFFHHSTEIRVRQLELFLKCHARYIIKDHKRHLRLCQVVTDICHKEAVRLTGTYTKPKEFFLKDIAKIRECQKDPSSIQSQLSLRNIHHIQELPGTSIASLGQQVACIPQTGLNYQIPLSKYTVYPDPQLISSIGVPTPSAAIFGPELNVTSAYNNLFSTANNMDLDITGPTTTMRWPVEPETPLPYTSSLQSPYVDYQTFPVGHMDTTYSATNAPAATEGPQPTSSLVCDICKRHFVGQNQVSNYRRHMREQHSSHSNECHVCQKKYKRPGGLTKHMAKHMTKHTEDGV